VRKRWRSTKRRRFLSNARCLLRRLSELRGQLARLKGGDQHAQLELEIRKLESRLADAQKEAYGGSKSERRKRKSAAPGERAVPTGHGPTSQPSLPRDVVLHTSDEADQVCPCCGDALHVMTGQFESSELIIAVERRYRIQDHDRQKYSCRCGDIDTALGVETRMVPGGRYDLSVAAQVATDKYLDSLPLERQVGRLARKGLVVTSQMLWDQLFALYVLLPPTLATLTVECLAQELLHLDETRFRKMGKGGSKKWWLWVASGADAVVFHLLPSRDTEAAKIVLDGYSGIVVSDGYNVYQSLAKLGGFAKQVTSDPTERSLPVFTHAACWAHARRPLFVAENNTAAVTDVLNLIEKLFHVEARARKRATAGEDLLAVRKALREAESRDIIKKIRKWRIKQRPLPKSKRDVGVGYLKNYWKELTVFLEDSRIPLDNTAAERDIRGPVIGRKNDYGVKSQRGAEVAAAFFSFFATCRRVGVDPQEWRMAAALAAKADPNAALTPAQFAADQAAGS
jgi:transposase